MLPNSATYHGPNSMGVIPIQTITAMYRKIPHSGEDQRLAPLWRCILPAWNHLSPDPSCVIAQPWLSCAALGLHNWLPKERVVFYTCVTGFSSQHPYCISLAINDYPKRSSVLLGSLIMDLLFCENCDPVAKPTETRQERVSQSSNSFFLSSAFLFRRQFSFSCPMLI